MPQPNFKKDFDSPEALNEDREALRHQHDLLDAILPMCPEDTGLILRMRSLEKKLDK